MNDAAIRVHTLCLFGLSAEPIEVELQFTGGLMQRVIMSGLPGSAIREARERVRGCLTALELPVPRKSVLINFAPADLPKDGNAFDLPLALGLLALQGELDPSAFASTIVAGELALDGRVRPVRGSLALALAARRHGARRLVLPARGADVATRVEGVEVLGVASLGHALDVLSGRAAPAPLRPPPANPTSTHGDLSDVAGLDTPRRAAEVAAAGPHHLMLVGPPGSGKTMLAQRLATLLPPLDEDTALEVSALHGLAVGGADARWIDTPPVRAPHHTISRAGLVGGGRPLMPGEISLAHGGVLILDEMPEFPRGHLESLRQPLEDGEIRLARAGRCATFPVRPLVVGTMNPCPCGHLGHPRRGCSCTLHQRSAYRQRISGPLLDRFDLFVEAPVPDAAELLAPTSTETSTCVAERVNRARAAPRLPNTTPTHPEAHRTLTSAIRHFALSGRAAHRLMSVSATIAALDGRDEATGDDVDEAVSLRRAGWETPDDD